MGGTSYTPTEVAEVLKISRYTVYELIKRGELAAFRIGRKVRVEASDLEDFKKKARGEAAPSARENGGPETGPDLVRQVIICGQDAVLDVLERRLEKKMPGYAWLRKNLGSINGLLALYQGQAHVATAHLWDGDTGEYNLPYIRHILPGQRVKVVNLLYRAQGFYTAPGNPLGIKGWGDLARQEIRFVNREPGSGTRVLLDEHLRILDLAPRQITGYEREATSHLAVASMVARGEADVGMGIESAARQVPGIEFVPLQRERYDLVMRREDFDKPFGQGIISLLNSSAFRKEVAGMGGYDTSHMGELVGEV
ncbi:MAG: helix-turn-helix transcriptional regulator [Firmicutes bacterium]|nr:helix-turn-helix transcriptional regulator [Bacillota bacterium]